ncbi:VOC family protein [Agromyces sp. LHK192]|uniref:VOC family protein n=1 Tax=Agromyces sp. LHK192 TaxID=2498704 RepID=UPI000FD74F94|nr:VOC family protein [Agromyces sp. LHK192]
MKLEFLFAPTSDLEATLALYRDGFGAEEVWREGDTTAALTLPGSDVQLMIDSNDADAPPGPVFVVDSVERFHETRPTALEVLAEPMEIPGGFQALYRDPHGLAVYVMDQSTDAATG